MAQLSQYSWNDNEMCVKAANADSLIELNGSSKSHNSLSTSTIRSIDESNNRSFKN